MSWIVSFAIRIKESQIQVVLLQLDGRKVLDVVTHDGPKIAGVGCSLRTTFWRSTSKTTPLPGVPGKSSTILEIQAKIYLEDGIPVN